MSFGGPEMIIVLILVLVLFGGSQLPKLARNLGKAQKEFKDGINEANKPDASTEAAKDASSNASTSSSDDAS